jgi:adenylate cyclase class IV
MKYESVCRDGQANTSSSGSVETEVDLLRQMGSFLRVEASAQNEHELGDVLADNLDALLALEAEAALL